LVLHSNRLNIKRVISFRVIWMDVQYRIILQNDYANYLFQVVSTIDHWIWKHPNGGTGGTEHSHKDPNIRYLVFLYFTYKSVTNR
jgi:hypothetical protein